MNPARSVLPPRRAPGRARWSLPLLAAVIAVIVVAGAVSNYLITRRAYQATVEGQGMLLDSALRTSLATGARPPNAALFEKLLEANSELGLSYCAMVTRRGHIIAEAGTPSSPPGTWEDPGDTERAVMLDPKTRTAHLVSRLPPPMPGEHGRLPGPGSAHANGPPKPPADGPPGLPPHLGGKRPPGPGSDRRNSPTVRCEFRPTIGEQLREESVRTLSIGFATAGTLLLVSIGLWRAWIRAAAAEADLQAQRHLASLGQMSAVLAHELRNPLSSLKGHAQLLEEQLDGRSRAKASRVVSEAKRLEALLSSLLAFARSGAIEPENANPRTVVTDAAAEFAELDQLSIDDAAAPATWRLDPTRVRQILVNLIDNAEKATEGPAPIAISIAADRKYLRIQVRDHGDGVPIEMREEIFEPFTTGRTQGTGLGLAVSRRIAELHGGTLTVGEAEGGGALFELHLPKDPKDNTQKRKRRISWQRS